MPTAQSTIWQFLQTLMPKDNSWFGIRDLYDLVAGNAELDAEDLEPVTPANSSPRWHRNLRLRTVTLERFEAPQDGPMMALDARWRSSYYASHRVRLHRRKGELLELHNEIAELAT